MSKTPTSTHTPPSPLTPSDSSLPRFLSAYSPKIRSQLQFPERGLEKQSFKDECDINNIMRRFQNTGVIDHLSQRPAMYGEIPELDFAGAMGIVVEARERFQALPAVVRDRFDNDPAKLLAFVQNPDNRDEAIKLGIVEPRQGTATPPAAPPPVSPTGAPPATPPSAS